MAQPMLTLVRNIGSSIGISIVIAQLTKHDDRMHANLSRVHHAIQQCAWCRPAIARPKTDLGRALMDQIITQQAAIIAYANDFKLLMLLTLVAIPFVLVIGRARAPAGKGETTHAMD